MAKGDMVPAAADDRDASDAEGPTGSDLAETGNKSLARATSPARPGRNEPGFFTIYKRSQGKWTRLGTFAAAAGLGLLTAYNLYQYALPYLPVFDPAKHNGSAVSTARTALLGAVVLFLAAYGVLVYWFGNKPANVDFLIATDSEMKKVNWTTKGELFGSTRVVVLFLIFVAVFLFTVDIIFQNFFHLIRVLH